MPSAYKNCDSNEKIYDDKIEMVDYCLHEVFDDFIYHRNVIRVVVFVSVLGTNKVVEKYSKETLSVSQSAIGFEMNVFKYCDVEWYNRVGIHDHRAL